MSHDFPGNVRELENLIEHDFILCRGGPIELHHLPRKLLEQVRPATVRPPGTSLSSIEAFHIADAIGAMAGIAEQPREEWGFTEAPVSEDQGVGNQDACTANDP